MDTEKNYLGNIYEIIDIRGDKEVYALKLIYQANDFPPTDDPSKPFNKNDFCWDVSEVDKYCVLSTKNAVKACKVLFSNLKKEK